MSSSKERSIPGAGAEQLAELFHATYERLAPKFGYTTRTDTRRFDRGSENGKLMIAVCDEILTWFDRQDKDYAAVVIANAEVATINVEQLKTIGQLRAVLERTADALNGLRADVEHALWPDSGFAPAAQESRDD